MDEFDTDRLREIADSLRHIAVHERCILNDETANRLEEARSAILALAESVKALETENAVNITQEIKEQTMSNEQAYIIEQELCLTVENEHD